MKDIVFELTDAGTVQLPTYKIEIECPLPVGIKNLPLQSKGYSDDDFQKV